MSYNKNCVKLLPVISKSEKYTIFNTEFDSNFTVGDKLYIMVVDSGTTDYDYFDSLNNSGDTYGTVGYELLKKENNKLTLNIIYDDLVSSGITGLTSDNCYIGRVYIKNGSIYRGVINGTMMYDVSLTPAGSLNLLWYQGILVTTSNVINDIDFNTKSNNGLLTKSVVLANGTINTFYTENNYGIGLSIINLLNSTITLQDCNINAGVFNNCELHSYANEIKEGILNNCFIGSTYIINGGTFNNCTLEDKAVQWLNGIWDSSWTGGTMNPFRTIDWSGGTWKNGVFPSTSRWLKGRFMKGIFLGGTWITGTFGTNDSVVSISTDINTILTSSDTIFSGTTWYGGTFNNGVFWKSAWVDGTFNGGLLIDGSIWTTGTFNNGIFSGSTWNNGIFNNGTMKYSTWNNGIFNGGIIQDGTIWNNGDFNNGEFISSVWNNGKFYNGKISEVSTWNNGNFYKGSMFNSMWYDGDLFFGVMNNIKWYGGTWRNGIANTIEFSGGTWKNGIFNYGTFHNGDWENGSFNSGYFRSPSNWYGGIFYYGEFDGNWYNGTFYSGKQTGIPQKDIIGRDFVQYNKSGLMSNRYNTVRLPAKKKY